MHGSDDATPTCTHDLRVRVGQKASQVRVGAQAGLQPPHLVGVQEPGRDVPVPEQRLAVSELDGLLGRGGQKQAFRVVANRWVRIGLLTGRQKASLWRSSPARVLPLNLAAQISVVLGYEPPPLANAPARKVPGSGAGAPMGHPDVSLGQGWWDSSGKEEMLFKFAGF
jgi:hypothetical protein